VTYQPNGALSQWVAEQFDPDYRGYGIDVGASDGISINTTYVLEKHNGWTIVSCEPNPDFHKHLKATRTWVEVCAVSDVSEDHVEFSVNPNYPECYSSLKPDARAATEADGCKNWHTAIVPVRTLDQILEKWEFPRLDLLAVDTEGTELDVLKGCDLKRWKPKAVIVESWDEVGPADEYLLGLGYVHKWRSKHNNAYVLEAK
jgi:FkbM family methyltransferase